MDASLLQRGIKDIGHRGLGQRSVFAVLKTCKAIGRWSYFMPHLGLAFDQAGDDAHDDAIQRHSMCGTSCCLLKQPLYSLIYATVVSHYPTFFSVDSEIETILSPAAYFDST